MAIESRAYLLGLCILNDELLLKGKKGVIAEQLSNVKPRVALLQGQYLAFIVLEKSLIEFQDLFEEPSWVPPSQSSEFIFYQV